jgi:hypothetical protein
MLTVDWTEVGAIATAVVAAVGLVVVAVLAMLAQAARRSAGAVVRLADAGDQLLAVGRSLGGRAEDLMDLASRQVQFAETRADVSQEMLVTLQEQAEIGELALLGAHAPVLVPARLSGEDDGAHGPLSVVLPDGVYYGPVEQSVGAWTIETMERKLVVCCAFRNVGVGPAVLHPYHRIDLVRRDSMQPLISFGGFAAGVAAVGSTSLIGFPLSAAEPSFGATLTLLDRPDDEIELMVTVYYRSASWGRSLWTRVRYQRHLRTSPAGLLSQVALELSAPDGAAA